jgi:hypothetical protein
MSFGTSPAALTLQKLYEGTCTFQLGSECSLRGLTHSAAFLLDNIKLEQALGIDLSKWTDCLWVIMQGLGFVLEGSKDVGLPS